MPIQITSFDPTQKALASFANTLPAGGVGSLVFYNDSGVTIDAMWNSEFKIIPAGMIDEISICDPAQIIQWQQDYILNNVSSWPASVVKVIGYRPDEKLPYAAFPVPLQRTSNVGNSIPVSTSTTSLQNDGNAPATQVYETTPSDQGVSADKWFNDASGQKQILSAGTQRNVEQVTRGNATSGKAAIVFGDAGDTSITTLHGTADLATNATNATNASSVPASGVTAGDLGTGVVIGTSTTDEIGYGVGGDSGSVGIESSSKNLQLAGAGAQGTLIGYNIYFDGTNFRYLKTGVACLIQMNTENQPTFHEYASGTAGAIVSQDQQGVMTRQKSSGGGSSGVAIWEGTTDPTSAAVEGDLWCNV